MSKELTPLEAFERVEYNLSEDGTSDLDDALAIVENALKEHESMKNTHIIVADRKISDDDLEKLKSQRMFVSSSEECKIEPLLDEETQKKLRALEIIKKKRVDLEYVKCCKNYEQYCLVCSYGNEITEEEYDIVKEVLL